MRKTLWIAIVFAGMACGTSSNTNGTGGNMVMKTGGARVGGSTGSGGVTNSGGMAGALSTGGNSATGGVIGTGGSLSTGGSPGTGGVVGNGGSPSTGGIGAGGAVGTGGSAGSSGTGGSGGAPIAGGAAAGSGGSTSGTGGIAGAGGTVKVSCVPPQKTIVVATDGSGQFTKIQAAIDSIPAGNKTPTLLSIRNGVYNERLLVSGKSFITFRGEDRAKTRVEYDQRCANGSDGYGCAMIYIAGGGEDIAFDNLTISNTYVPKDILTDKAIALRWAGNATTGAATRLLFKDTDILGKGGDTLYLERNGYYYLSGVKLAGTFHILVPRGTAWVTNSTFDCLANPDPLLPGCLFNENNRDIEQKLVIHNSILGQNDTFNLGSYFRDTAWYFIDSKFSEKMMDKPIWRDPKNDVSSNIKIQWGERIYFAGNTGPDYAWLKDNIETSAAKTKAAVTLDWVFPDWNPGNSLVCAK